MSSEYFKFYFYLYLQSFYLCLYINASLTFGKNLCNYSRLSKSFIRGRLYSLSTTY